MNDNSGAFPPGGRRNEPTPEPDLIISSKWLDNIIGRRYGTKRVAQLAGAVAENNDIDPTALQSLMHLLNLIGGLKPLDGWRRDLAVLLDGLQSETDELATAPSADQPALYRDIRVRAFWASP
jgi:hypothetical protein